MGKMKKYREKIAKNRVTAIQNRETKLFNSNKKARSNGDWLVADPTSNSTGFPGRLLYSRPAQK